MQTNYLRNMVPKFVLIFFICCIKISSAEESKEELLNAFCNVFKISSCQCQDIDIFSKKGGKSNLCSILNVNGSTEHKDLYTLREHSTPNIATRYCNFFKMAYSNCSCSDILVRNGRTIVESCKRFVPVTKAPVISTVYDLCKRFNISRENCSCDLFTGMDLDLCDHFKNPKLVTVLYTHEYQIVYAAIATVTAFLGILGNMQVILVSQLRSRRTRNNFNWLIKLLAIYDCTFALLQIVVVIPKFWTPMWLYKDFFCRFFNSIDYLSTFLAAGVILIISIERYIKLFHPLREFTRKKLNIALSFHFIASFAAVLPLFIYSETTNRFQTCRVNWGQSKNAKLYNILIFVFFFLLPISLVMVLYSRIINHFVVSGKKLADVHQSKGNSQHNQDNKRAIISMVSVVLIFILFVFPRHIVTIYLDAKGWNGVFLTGDQLSIHSFFALMYVAHIPYFFHVCSNPIIYSITDSRWWKDFKDFLYKVKNVGISESISMTTYTTMNVIGGAKKQDANDEEGLPIIEDANAKKISN